MKKIKNWLTIALFMVTAISFAQTKISGNVVDNTNQPLPGATVIVVGTTNGATTDFDGNFFLSTTKTQGTIKVSYVGFNSKTIPFKKGGNLGTITLEEDKTTLSEVVITATSFAVDRKTPVAVSTIKAADIGVKLGTQEFPEILKATPGVYATKKGGGYGDSRINLRGFSSENIGVLINGVPVNDMENGKVYWSNWAGLSDVTAAMQVQRGLGASKVAVPSVGGTINIISKSTDVKKGGSINGSLGNDGYIKYGMTYSTGLSDNGFAFTVSANKMSGNGYVDGTEFDGFNYFINISKKFNDQHKLSFTGFGAKQTHGQRYTRNTIQFYRATEQGGKKFNPDWGYRNGQIEHTSYNFYHKPQFSLNHDWHISDKTFLTTALYASIGVGGGRRTKGDKFKDDSYRLGGVDQPVNYDKIVAENMANGVNGSSNVFYASMNSHEWYGILSTLKTDINENLKFTGGFDGRYYIGHHYSELTDLLGGQYYIGTTGINENKPLKVGDRFSYDNDGIVKRYGLFAQLEYSKDALSAFLSSSISNTNYQRQENFLEKPEKSDAVNFLGYGTKGGVNYNINDAHNVFANIGYFSNAPFFRSVFVRYDNNYNKNAANEKVFSAELGYGFKTDWLSANLNVYRTSWLDKSLVISEDDRATGERLYANIEGLDALHQGVELDFVLKLSDKLKMTGMVSLGDWTWQSDVKGVIRDEAGNELATKVVNAKGLKVSDAAQTTYALGLNYSPVEKTKLFVDYNYAGDIYARIDINGSTDRKNAWKMPSYGLFDLGFSHSLDIGEFDATLTGKLNNIFDTEYISDAFDAPSHNAEDVKVYYGAGRTFSLGLKVKF